MTKSTLIILITLMICLNFSLTVMAGTKISESENSTINRIDSSISGIITYDLEKNKVNISLSEGNSSASHHPPKEKIIGEVPHIIPSQDIENGRVQLEIDLAYTGYKDNEASEHTIPFALRIDTGHNTEFRIASDFLEFQDPYFGINDISLGFKWQFREGNPSMGVLTMVELPTGSEHFTDDAVEPSLTFLFDHKFNEKWGISTNIGWTSNVDTDIRYNQGNYGLQISYHLNSNNSISISAGSQYPNNNEGVGLVTAGIGYGRTVSPDFQFTIHVIRGLSGIDKSWATNIGFNWRL